MSDNSMPSAGMPDDYDRQLGSFDGIPGVSRSKEHTITVIPPLGIGGSRSFIVQTIRTRDSGDDSKRAVLKDYVFVRMVGASRSFREVLPPDVCDAIARQRDSLTAQARKRGARAAAATRKARGIVPNVAAMQRGKQAKRRDDIARARKSGK